MEAHDEVSTDTASASVNLTGELFFTERGVRKNTKGLQDIHPLAPVGELFYCVIWLISLNNELLGYREVVIEVFLCVCVCVCVCV